MSLATPVRVWEVVAAPLPETSVQSGFQAGAAVGADPQLVLGDGAVRRGRSSADGWRRPLPWPSAQLVPAAVPLWAWQWRWRPPPPFAHALP